MNKVALVTGSSRGLGREIAIALAKEGYDIAVNFSRNRKKAEEVQQEIEQLGRKCVIFKA
ncbi:TPA_asm: SDR family NAD(P)-dependent oxidoreductase, partial [Listeria monocytogenes]|nr:SDR family NAD(P)-dependent oxidoreductase [Listeria monocytogenes]